MFKKTLFSAAIAVACAPLAWAAPEAPVSGAVSGSPFYGAADTNGGYSGLVLQKVLPHWQPPQGANGMAKILVRLTAQGRVMSCEPLPDPLTAAPAAPATTETIPGTSATVRALTPPPPPVSPQEKQLADAACRAVAAAGDFETPPYGMIAEVSLFLSAGNARGALEGQPADYASLVLHRAQPYIDLPPRLTGEFKVGISVRVRGDGGVESIRVSQPSGRNDVDAAVVQALSKPGVIPPPPGGVARELQLTYTLRGQ